MTTIEGLTPTRYWGLKIGNDEIDIFTFLIVLLLLRDQKHICCLHAMIQISTGLLRPLRIFYTLDSIGRNLRLMTKDIASHCT